MEQPLVSVFLPTYNHVEYIDEAIRSAVEQNYDRLEVVVGDDGSTDGTRERVLDHARRWAGRVVPMVDLPHLGITGNCNRTLAACRGQYVVFHGGDDVFLPGKVEAQARWFDADEQRVMCGHAVELFDSRSGSTLGVTTGPGPLRGGQGAVAIIKDLGLFPGLSVAIRRSAIPPAGLDARIEVVSDWKLQIDSLAAGGRYGFVDGVYSRSRVHSESVSYRSTREEMMHHAFFGGFMMTLAIIEIEWPGLMSACFHARGRVLFNEARWHQAHGDPRKARRFFVQALRHGIMAKGAAGALMTTMPEAVTREFEIVLHRLRPR